MKRAHDHSQSGRRIGALAGLLLVFAVPLFAEETSVKTEESKQPAERVATDDEEKAKQEAKPPSGGVYVPPSRGTVRTRVGAGTRGPREDFPTLYAVAPDHVAWTLESQPTLWWYLAGAVDTRVEISLLEDSSVDPLLEVGIPPPVTGGMRPLSLREHGVELETGRIYRWFVALVPDPTRRSLDVVASGAIERRPGSGDLRRQLASAGDSEKFAVLARNGIWYDAVDALSRRIAADPTNRALQRERAGLLAEVGLDAATNAPDAPGPAPAEPR